MAKKKRKQNDKAVWDSMTDGTFRGTQKEIHSVFPKQFLIGLRLALESGMSYQEITSMLILHSALSSIYKHVPQSEIVTRTQTIVNVIREDIRLTYRGRINRKLKAADQRRSENEPPENP